MYLWQVKGDMGLLVIPETHQLSLYTCIFQESKLIFPGCYPLVDAGTVVKIVVITKPILIDDLVHHFTAIAAEYFFFKVYPGRNTIFAAMVAPCLIMCNSFRRHISGAKLSPRQNPVHDQVHQFR